jgi:hypothetical protein
MRIFSPLRIKNVSNGYEVIVINDNESKNVEYSSEKLLTLIIRSLIWTGIDVVGIRSKNGDRDGFPK